MYFESETYELPNDLSISSQRASNQYQEAPIVDPVFPPPASPRRELFSTPQPSSSRMSHHTRSQQSPNTYQPELQDQLSESQNPVANSRPISTNQHRVTYHAPVSTEYTQEPQYEQQNSDSRPVSRNFELGQQDVATHRRDPSSTSTLTKKTHHRKSLANSSWHTSNPPHQSISRADSQYVTERSTSPANQPRALPIPVGEPYQDQNNDQSSYTNDPGLYV